ncbi:RNA-binding domain-containing protein [Corynebacterium sp. A21]|uniref:RNA-binding domain-containing protein n=1 Tax=Corynebacterium sp. A21 TaxID=3457318 RepID=UPI003FD06791
MTDEELLSLIDGGEKINVEFKRRRNANDLSDQELVAAVACLANGEGGVLFIGVEDNGHITGCAPWGKGRTDPNPVSIESLIAHHTLPPLTTTAGTLTVDSQKVLWIEVPKSGTPVGTSKGIYRRRTFKLDGTPECIAMDPTYLFSAYNAANQRDWARLDARGAHLNQLDPQEFERFRRLIKSGRGGDTLEELADEQILRALGFMDDSSHPIKLGGILLFGTPSAISRWVPNHEVLLQVRDGEDILLNRRFTGPLLATLEEVSERLDVYRKEEEIPLGLLRVSLPNLPERLIREALANALVHRDYTALGGVQIILDNQSFTVVNPGGFPRGVTFESLLVASQPRSPSLAESLKRANLVDRAGRGIQVMYRILLSAGRDEPDYSATTDNQVILSFAVAGSNREFATFVTSWQQRHGDIELQQLRLLQLLHDHKRMPLYELSELLHEKERKIRTTLNQLEDIGLVEIIGGRNSREFRLGPEFFNTVGRPADFIRSKELDSVRAGQLVTTYVQQYGKVTRKEVADLCGMDSQAAYRLLKSLVDAGELVQHGTTRSTYYTTVDGAPRD